MLRVIIDRFESGESALQADFAKPVVEPDHTLCFVLMPFNQPDLQVVYEDFVKPTVEGQCGLRCERADDIFGPNVVMDDVWRALWRARVVVAELTGRNPNVFYEVGLCHAIGKKVLLLAQSIEDIPFDLRHRRVIRYEYSPRGCRELERTLGETIKAMLKEI
jgi:hypothetical protein